MGVTDSETSEHFRKGKSILAWGFCKAAQNVLSYA